MWKVCAWFRLWVMIDFSIIYFMMSMSNAVIASYRPVPIYRGDKTNESDDKWKKNEIQNEIIENQVKSESKNGSEVLKNAFMPLFGILKCKLLPILETWVGIRHSVWVCVVWRRLGYSIWLIFGACLKCVDYNGSKMKIKGATQ